MSKIIIPQSEFPYVIDQLTNTLPETYDKTVRFRYRVVNNNRNIYSDWSIIGSVQQQTLLERIDDGLPTGGNLNDLPVKQGPGDYDVGWQPISTLLPTDIVYDNDNSLVPPGGLIDQVLTKTSNADYAIDWKDPGGGGGTGGAILGTINTVADDAVTTTVTLAGTTVSVAALNISGHTLAVGSTVGVVSAIDDVNWTWYVVSRYQPNGVPYTVVPGQKLANFPVVLNTSTANSSFAVLPSVPACYFPNTPIGGGGFFGQLGTYISTSQAGRGAIDVNRIYTSSVSNKNLTRYQTKGGFLFSLGESQNSTNPTTVYYWDHRIGAWGNIGSPPSHPVNLTSTIGALGVASNGNLCYVRAVLLQINSISRIHITVSWFNPTGSDPLVGSWTNWTTPLVISSSNSTASNFTNNYQLAIAPNGVFTLCYHPSSPNIYGATAFGRINANSFVVYPTSTSSSNDAAWSTVLEDGTQLHPRVNNGKITIVKMNPNGDLIATWETNLPATQRAGSSGGTSGTDGMYYHPLALNNLSTTDDSNKGANSATMDMEGNIWFPVWYRGTTNWYIRVFRGGGTPNVTLVDEIDMGTGNLIDGSASMLKYSNWYGIGGPINTNKVAMVLPSSKSYTIDYPPTGNTVPAFYNFHVYDY